jgi:hypothetical protein
LQANVPYLAGHYEEVTTIYVKQFGPGNLRIGSDRDSLVATIGAPIAEGIAQATADGFKQYFWEGDLWFISDAPGVVSYGAPSYQYYVQRGKNNGAPNNRVEMEAELEGDLSTY